MSTKASSRRMGPERAARHGLGSHLRLKQKPPLARDAGDVGLPARRGLSLEQQQLRQLVTELQAKWQQAPGHLGHVLEGLYLAYLIGLQGARSLGCCELLRGAEREPPRDCPPQCCRAGERHRAWDAPARPHPGHVKILGKAGARLSPPERRQGKRGARPGNCRPEEPPRLHGGKKERSPGKKARARPPLRPCPEPRPLRHPKDPLWLPDPVREKRAAQTTACARWGRWQRELELAFEELLDTNQKLKKHLILQQQGPPGPPGGPGTTSPQADPRPAEDAACHAQVDPDSAKPRTQQEGVPGCQAGFRSPQSPAPEAAEELPLLDTQLPKLGAEQRRGNHLELLQQTERLKLNLESRTPKELEERRGPGSPARASREVGSTSLLAARALGSTSLLTSREVGSTSLLASREVGSTSLLAARALGSTSLLASREVGSTSLLTSRALGSTSLLASREVRSTSLLTSRALGSTSLLASRTPGSTPHLVSRELGSTPLPPSRESGSTPYLTSQESGSTTHLTSQESRSTSGLSSPCLASLPTPSEQEEGRGAKSPLLPPSATSVTDGAPPRRKPRDLQQQRQLHQQFLEDARKRLREFQEVN